MNIDEQIKKDLAEQAKELDKLMDHDESLLGYMKQGFNYGYAWLVKVAFVLALVLSVLLVFCGYQFFTAAPEHELFWGVLLILTFNAQVATKLFIYMQINRNHTAREIRLLELRLQATNQPDG
ncbi:hypothetical protein SAMN06297229_0188 [Pseudidiomarina planktonica]|uniref:Uncharacterized protein n=1 Tax=Pseudidiomarina planktonica TaxID=1323738 RepID=A0A1Y6E8F9_9GAMM|nr:DUF6768 family protein [Pseudidiomarina planktonica]RUO66313.1 hypothetical protein CWI77_07795 [Pseudidiomarina planktonica]SMQ58915.1 hypothetical protein SAMN06297229_0188 [Pseudidiomarina planktonica]